MRQALGRQVVQVARIGQSAEAEAERVDVPVVLEERQHRHRAARTVDEERLSGADAVLGEDRRIG